MYNGKHLDIKANDPIESALSNEKTFIILDQGKVIGKLINKTEFDAFKRMNPNINNYFSKYNPISDMKELIPLDIIPRTLIYDDREYTISITFTG